MKVAILSLLLLGCVIHHCDCLPRKDDDVNMEAKLTNLLRRLTKINNDERLLKKGRGTYRLKPIPTDIRSAVVRQDASNGTQEYTESSGIIQSPGYAASSYGDNAHFQWRITAPPSYVISVTFQELSLEADENCEYDSLSLYDGSSANSPQLGKYCTFFPAAVSSSRSSLFIVFKSDRSIHKGRFSLSWSFVRKGGQDQGYNVALNKPAIQSSTYNSHWARLAVDGRYDTVSCTLRHQHPWWAVYLGAPYQVIHVTVTNDANTYFAYRLNNFVVGLTNQDPATTAPVYNTSYTLCAQYNGSLAPSESADIVCASSSQNFSFVIVQGSHTTSEAICLAEVSVYVKIPTSGRGCGNPTVEPDVSMSRIVGGDEARKYSSPWMCWLGTCGASIIDEYYILTAAHCLVKDGVQKPDDDITVMCGRHNVTERWEYISEQIFTGVTATVHEEYGTGHGYDIAVIRLPRPLTFNDYVMPVCLPSSPVAAGTNCIHTGWGTTQNTGDNSVLRQVSLPIVDWDVCDSIFVNGGRGHIPDNGICAGPRVASKSTCFGDSGGPLVCKQGDRWFQYGASSFLYSRDCHLPIPSGFASVYYFLPWIQQHTGIGASARMKSKHRPISPLRPYGMENEMVDKEEKELLDLLQRKLADD